LHPSGLHRPGLLVPSPPRRWLGCRWRNQHQRADPGLWPGQPPGRRGRLDHAETQRRPHRMDPTTTSRLGAPSACGD